MSWRQVKISKFLTERKGRFKPAEAIALNLKRIEKIDFDNRLLVAILKAVVPARLFWKLQYLLMYIVRGVELEG